MVEHFRKTLFIIDNLNKKCKNKILYYDEIIEQFENLKDLERILQDYDKVIQFFESNNCSNKFEIEEKLAELHYILNTINWHIDEIHTLVVKMFKEYNSNIID